MTLPSLTSSGAGRSRSPRASKSTTPPRAAAAISRGDLALRPEGHARDIALLDLQRRGSEPLAPGVEEHHAAAAADAAISRGDLALRPEGHAPDMPSLTSSGGVGAARPGRRRAPRRRRADAAYPAAILPSGPKATLLTSPSGTWRKRTTSGRASSERCRLPRASSVSPSFAASRASNIARSSRSGLTASDKAASRRNSAILVSFSAILRCSSAFS